MIVCMGEGGPSLCASLCIGLWADMLGQCSLMMLTCVRVTFPFLFQVSCLYFYCKYILHHKYTHIQLYPLGPYFQFLNVVYSVWIIGQRTTQGGYQNVSNSPGPLTRQGGTRLQGLLIFLLVSSRTGPLPPASPQSQIQRYT